MFTLHSSKPTVDRVAASLKFALLLVLLGLIVVATERPMLLTPAGAVTVSDDAPMWPNRRKTQRSAPHDGRRRPQRRQTTIPPIFRRNLAPRAGRSRICRRSSDRTESLHRRLPRASRERGRRGVSPWRDAG